MSAHVQDDQTLLRRYRDTGDAGAFTMLVDRHLPLVYNTAHRDLFHEHDAKDVSQEVFAKLAIKGRSLRIRHLGSWLYICTQNQVRMMKRSEGRRRARETRAAEMAAVEVAVYQSGEPDAGPKIRELFSDLPEKDQRALFLRFHDELDFREIGEAMGTNQRAAQKRVYRAIEKLRQSLSKRGITTTAALVAAGLASGTARPIPPGLDTAVVKSAIFKAAAAPVPSALTIWLATPGAFSAVAAVAVVALVGAAFWATGDSSSSGSSEGALASAPAADAAASSARAAVRDPALAASASNASIAVDAIEAIYALPEEEREPYLARLGRHLQVQNDASYLADLFERWSALDHQRCARAGLELFDAYDDDAGRDALLTDCLSIPVQAWQQAEQPALERWLTGLPRTHNGEPFALDAVILAIAPTDASAAFALLAGRGSTDDRPYEILGQSIAAGGVTSAWETLAALPDTEKTGAASTRNPGVEIEDDALAPKVRIVAATVAKLTEDDPQAVADWIAKLPDTEHANAVTGAFAATWAKFAPADAAKWATHLSNEARRTIVPGIAEQWAADDAAVAVAWAANPELTEQPFASAREAFQMWSHESFSQASEWLEAHRESSAAAPLFGDASDTLEPQAAIEWATGLPVGVGRNRALQHAFYAMAHSDASQAEELLATIQPPAAREGAAFAFAQGLYTSAGRTATTRWAKTVAEAGRAAEANAARAAEVSILASINPDLMAEKVLGMDSGGTRDAMLSELVRRTYLRSETHARKASDWAENFADTGLRAQWRKTINDAHSGKPWDTPAQLPRGGSQALKSQNYSDFRSYLDILASLPPLRR